MLAGLPLDDWQFWVVSGLVLSAIWLLVSPFLPRKKRRKPAPCPGCPGGSEEKAAKPKHVDLTIGGKRVRS
jgi:hypothetical protein